MRFKFFHSLLPTNVFSRTELVSYYCTASRIGKDALRKWEGKELQGVPPDANTFITLLKACAPSPDLEEVRRIHAEATNCGCGDDVFLRTSLVDLYGKCGSIVDARNVFDSLCHRDVVSWNAMLAAYSQQGEAEKALDLYEQMQDGGVPVNGRTFVSTLQACGVLADKDTGGVEWNGQFMKAWALSKGRALHAEIWKKNYLLSVFIGSALIGMYGKCGSVADAAQVFDGMHVRNTVSWNAMLRVYVNQGQAMEALQLYHSMRQEGVSPTAQTFTSALQACGMCADQQRVHAAGSRQFGLFVTEGKVIHADAYSRGYSRVASFANTVISMYRKCGSILDAQHVFDEFVGRDSVSWNTLLAAYVDEGQAQMVLQLYKQMLVEGVDSDARTFTSVIQACQQLAEREEGCVVDGARTKVESISLGAALHAHVWWKGHRADGFIASTLISMYGKCRSLVSAQLVFAESCGRNVVVWTAMLAACIEHGEPEQALQLYEKMWEAGACPNERTFVCVLQAIGVLAEKEESEFLDGRSSREKWLGKGKAIHSEVRRLGCDSDVFVGNTLVSMYGKCESVADAEEMFHAVRRRNVISWTAMLAAYVQQGEAEKALQLYDKMGADGVSPDARAFVAVLVACGMLAEKHGEIVKDGRTEKLALLQKVQAVHCGAQKKGYVTDVFVGNSLICTYGKLGCTSDAKKVFQGLSRRDEVSWNAMLSAYTERSQWDMTLQLYRQMEDEDISPDDITIVYALQACSNTGSLGVCRQIDHAHVSSREKPSRVVVNTLIHAYGRCASMADAQAVFNKNNQMSQSDLVSWNALIAGYSRGGHTGASLQCYKDMQAAGVKPNGVTFLALLSACSHAGLVDQGLLFFESMQREHGISPEMEHYVGLVDLLGRAGHFLELEALLSGMPMQPNVAFWMCLLGACQKHGKVELGKLAFDCAVGVEPGRSAAYVIMRNIYADAGLVEHALRLNALRQAGCVKKVPGQSWIEHDSSVHTFTVGEALLA